MLDRILPAGSWRRDTAKRLFIESRTPAHISENFREVHESALDRIGLLLEQNYFADCLKKCPSDDLSRDLLSSSLLGRLEKARRLIIPWLDDARELRGANVLEIGCGTGSSTVALAEQGANVTAVDVDENSLNVAKERCRVYNVGARLFKANATEVHRLFADQHFDLIIFYASLEHMTHEERMIAMKNTWDMLSTGDLWSAIEIPNRLWYRDFHTSFLPFFMWLPDDLAFKYSCFSPRNGFRELYREYDEASILHFLRRGRGVSFHEFELTMEPLSRLNVISSLHTFRRKRLANWLRWRFSLDRRYESLLSKICPDIHEAFCQRNLSLIIKKA